MANKLQNKMNRILCLEIIILLVCNLNAVHFKLSKTKDYLAKFIFEHYFIRHSNAL